MLNFSIKKIFLFSFLIALTVFIFLDSVFVYYGSVTNIQTLVKRDMVHNLVDLEIFFSPENIKNYAPIQKNIDNLDSSQIAIWKKLHYKSADDTSEKIDIDAANEIQYAILEDEKFLIKTSAFPTLKIDSSQTINFFNENINGTNWQFLSHQKNGYTYLVAVKSQKKYLLHPLIKNTLIISLGMIPFLLLSTWFLLHFSFASIRNLSSQLKRRASYYLDPIQLKKTPSELKDLVAEVNRLFLRIKKGIERDQRFSGDAAHELRTPLAVISAQTQVAKELIKENKSEEAILTLRKVIMAVENATHIIHQLLTLSRLNVEKNQAPLEMIDILQIARDITSDLALIAVDKNVDLELEAEDYEQLMVKGTHGALMILVRNLVDNAIRYTPHGGQVIVRFVDTPEAIILTVEDTGPGIPNELKARVFERFYRVLGTNQQGSGLGLAIVEQIAESLHAKIVLKDQMEGTGLIVEITFPKKESSNSLE
jgi:two-component system sensor histidine kinase QseC